MTHISEFDSFRDPTPPRKRRKRRRPLYRKGNKNRDAGGARETPVVPDAEFISYYGKPVVKAPPWGAPISAYLFLGGLAGGSALLAEGATLTGNDKLRRNTRFAGMTAAGIGSVALIADLGRPERLLHMFRVFKLSSPMSVGSWILGAFSSTAGIATAAEFDTVTKHKLPIPKFLRKLLHWSEHPAGAMAAAFGAPLAVYTSVLLADTSVPAWQNARKYLPYLFVSSATQAAGGLAMVLTPVNDAKPARIMSVIGATGDVIIRRCSVKFSDKLNQEPYEIGKPGKLLETAEHLTLAGGLGALLFGNKRPLAMLSGACLVAGSAFTRFGVVEAGKLSVKDPKYVVEAQRRRLEKRRAAGDTDDSITTA